MEQVHLLALALLLLRPAAVVVAQRPRVEGAEQAGLERHVADDVLVAQAEIAPTAINETPPSYTFQPL